MRFDAGNRARYQVVSSWKNCGTVNWGFLLQFQVKPRRYRALQVMAIIHAVPIRIPRKILRRPPVEIRIEKEVQFQVKMSSFPIDALRRYAPSLRLVRLA